ncbi:hypothetical protein BDW75DRAFT_223500 [Aspergillus navahoensis]
MQGSVWIQLRMTTKWSPATPAGSDSTLVQFRLLGLAISIPSGTVAGRPQNGGQ